VAVLGLWIPFGVRVAVLESPREVISRYFISEV
jgi:hypothetical protein